MAQAVHWNRGWRGRRAGLVVQHWEVSIIRSHNFVHNEPSETLGENCTVWVGELFKMSTIRYQFIGMLGYRALPVRN